MKQQFFSDVSADFAALIADYQGGGHSVFRPSTSPRWMVCAGSLQAEIINYQDKAGEAAAQGTVAHYLADQWFTLGRRPRVKIGSKRVERGFVITIDAEMMAHVEDYVLWCEELGPADYVAHEQRVDFSDLTPIPDQGGTADHIHILGRHLTITDFKYGTAHRVYARNNKQARLYAYGVFREWDWLFNFQTITIRIFQPRLDVAETWTITREELLAFAEEARRAAHLAWTPGAPRTPDPEACRYCPVRGSCPALVEAAEALADERLDDMDGMLVQPETVSVRDELLEPRTDPTKMSNEELGRVLRWRGAFDAWFRSVHDEAVQRADNGGEIPGWKIVEGSTHRAWVDPNAAAELLAALGLKPEETETRRLVSPKRVIDLLRARKIKPEVINHAWTKPPGRRSLVSELDGTPGLSDLSDRLDSDDLA